MKTGWVTKRLGEVCEELRERIPSTSVLPRQYVGTENMLKECAGIVDSESVPKDVGLVRYQKGDILLSNIRPYLKKSWLSDRDGGCSSDVIVFRPSQYVVAEYLWRVLSQDRFFDYSMLKVGGAKMPRGDRNWIKAFEFSYPESLAEQKRIVAKIDAAFEKIDKLKANAERNLANAKELFQSALNEAMRPKPGWVEKRLGECYTITSSKRVFKDQWKNAGVPFYRAREIVRLARDGYVDNELFVSEEMFKEYGKKYGLPCVDDIMITGVGTLGVCYVVKENDRFYFKDGNIIWLKKNSHELDSRFVELCFSTDAVKKQVHANQGTTVGTYTIEMAKATVVHAPSLEEQVSIVNVCNKYREVVVGLQSNYTRLIADCAEMRQAVLKEAFEGRL